MSLSSACFFCFWLVCSSKTLPKLHMSRPPSPLRSLLTCELFQWNIFEFSFISTWLLNLFSCCLYIILILLWFLKFHLYYILGPRDHPDIVDSFMQLQAQVCFLFLISFTLGFSPSSSLLLISPCFSVLFSLSASFCSFLLGPQVSHLIGWADEWNMRGMFEKETSVSPQTLLILTVTSTHKV